VALLLYAYCVGMASSRQIEKACKETVAFRVLTANQDPDHDTIAEFRRRHLKALAALFIQVLNLCHKAGMVRLGQVVLEGTKVKANASKHKARSYDRMQKSAAELEVEVKRLLGEAEAVDQAEDKRFGKGLRGDELPEALRFKETRLAKIKEAKEALEREARERAEQERREQEEKRKDRDPRGRPSQPPSETPDPRAQRNFTDPESRIMKEGATQAFVQAYNCQAAVDGQSQVIVSTRVTQQANDKRQLQPGVEQIKANLDKNPKQLGADSGYYNGSFCCADGRKCLPNGIWSVLAIIF
jgi:hypothetical protein